MLLSHLSFVLTVALGQLPAVLADSTPTAAASSPAGDSVLVEARNALARGRPWQASRFIESILSDTGRRTPEAVYLAATAASEWGGWPEVARQLTGEPWLDSLYAGRGRLLLARAALALGNDSLALGQSLAAPPTSDDSTDGERLVLMAMALDRLDARDSSASTYERAAARLPLVADWLLVHAAAVTDDSAERARLYDKLADPLARYRMGWSEAAAHERTGDLEGAARRYVALGERVTALRLRLAASPDSDSREAVRRDLTALVAARRSASEVRAATAMLDSVFAPLTPAEELVVARAAASSGPPARAVAGYARAFDAGIGKGEDRFGYATALGKVGRYADAAFQFNLVRAPRALLASAAYQRARALVRDGQVSEGREALVAIGRRFPSDTASASIALFLLGDLAADDRADDQARRYNRRLALRYPTSTFAPTARFRAALLELLHGDPARAAREFDELWQRYSGSDEAPAAIYWAGRACAAAGDTAAARSRWALVAGGDPGSYYVGLGLKRLGLPAWSPVASPDSFIVVPAMDASVARAALLARLGLAAESKWEYDRLARTQDTSSERLLALANAFRAQGFPSQAISLARRALAHGARPDARTYRLLYPVGLAEALGAESAEHGLDPSLVAALIRQESMFNPAATSAVGARGLMQVMPDLGARLAASLNFPIWDPVLLYQPDVSLQLGTFHLQELAEMYQEPVHILAAYNAGASRVERWATRKAVDDPEVFAERIPFAETRGYVRAIQRNQDIYRALYPWTGGGDQALRLDVGGGPS
ncbi:MAG: transglycosylase SLT domain-containing protein [Gemmatimonadales bacterium]